MIQEHLPQLADNAYRMIDISGKVATDRTAIAEGRIYIPPGVIQKIERREIPKGDVLALAEVAGIMAAKNTALTLPLCHPIQIESVRVKCDLFEQYIQVTAEVHVHAKTGVEMEALCAVNAALLCIYDLTKVVEKDMSISDIRLLKKTGGKSGVWISNNNREIIDKKSNAVATHCGVTPTLTGIDVAIITVSDRCSQGKASDTSGPAIAEWLQIRGASVQFGKIIPDEKSSIQALVKELVLRGHRLVITTGGTGLSPRDVTPESILEIADREIVGFGELLRAKGAEATPMSYLSRSTAALIGSSVILALPGNPKAVIEGLTTLEILLPHALHVARGGKHGGNHVP